MYICDECGNAFDTPHLVKEKRADHYYETYAESPCCHESFSEASICPVCEDTAIAEGEIVCKYCAEELDNKLYKLKKESKLSAVDFSDYLDSWLERNW